MRPGRLRGMDLSVDRHAVQGATASNGFRTWGRIAVLRGGRGGFRAIVCRVMRDFLSGPRREEYALVSRFRGACLLHVPDQAVR